LLRENNINYTIVGDIDKGKQFATDIIWEYHLNRKLILETAGSYRFFDDLYLERQYFDFQPEDCSFASALIKVYTDGRGQTLGGHLTLTYHPFPQLYQRFFYSYRTEIAGNDIFRDVWQTMPQHKASYRLTYAPLENFLVWGMLSYFSAANFPDYQNINAQSCALGRINVKYSATVRSSATFDLQFQKWFWRRKLQASLLLRNIWDGNYRYHPIGASFDRSFYIHLQGLLPIISF
jgi:hypothetical protein